MNGAGGNGGGGAADCFKKGAIVEVSMDEEGFRGSWYSATVLGPVSKKTNKIYLEFHDLLADDNRFLRDHLDILLLRPLPPRELHRSFLLGDDVDAYHNDGWWEGIVTQLLPPRPPPPPPPIPTISHPDRPTSTSTSTSTSTEAFRYYSVFFRCSREQLEFPETQLRLHREWVYGKWVPPLEPHGAHAPTTNN